MTKKSKTDTQPPTKRGIYLRDKRAFWRLVVVGISIALGGSLIRGAFLRPEPSRPPKTAFLLFGLAVLLLLIDPSRLTFWKPIRRAEAPRKRSKKAEEEMSVLDWVKSLSTSRLETAISDVKKTTIAFPVSKLPIPRVGDWLADFRWSELRFPIAIVFALFAQFGLERKGEGIGFYILLYLLAGALFAWGVYKGDLRLSRPDEVKPKQKTFDVRFNYLSIAGVLSLLVFLLSYANTFTFPLVILWIGASLSIMLAFWEGDINLRELYDRGRSAIRVDQISLHLNRWSILWVLVFGIAAYLRFTRLVEVPYEMWSDHVEKLLDVVNVLNGNHSIYFPANTGREPIQFYLSIAIAQFFGTGITFLTLKIGTALIGLITLPYIYLFAKEFGGRELGLTAMFLVGIAYWPNTISRIGLRFPLYPLFAAPVLYHFIRGIRLHQRNHILVAGFFTGISLYGYSPARVLPIAIVVGLGIYILHRQSHGQRALLMNWVLSAGIIAFVLFVPLFRVALEMPDIFLNRILTRLGTAEQAYPGNPLLILLENIWNGLLMFGWDNGGIWAVSITDRPALDWITGAFFHLGLVMVAFRYVRKRNWVDLFMLLLIPVLMLPSTLSLAFPGENPAPNRASGVMVPVFTIAAIPLIAFLSWARNRWAEKRGLILNYLFIGSLLFLSMRINSRLVFQDFSNQIRSIMLNTSEIGQVVQGFADSIGSYDTAHVIPYDYWVDTRAIGILVGKPSRDYATWPDDLPSLVTEERPQLFLLHPLDRDSLDSLEALFPDGSSSMWHSQIEGMDFILYLVPPRGMDWYLETEPE